MACTQIPEPASTSPATSDWQKELAKVAYIGGEARKFRLTNWDNTNEPQVEIGSRFEVNSAYYVCSANESITGWTGISDATYCYVYATASAGTVTFSYSSTAPTYSAALGGMYNGTTRALFKIYRTDVTHWDKKRYADTFGDTVAQADISDLANQCDAYYIGTEAFGNIFGFTNALETGTSQEFNIYKSISARWSVLTDISAVPSSTTQIQLSLGTYGWQTLYTASHPGTASTQYYYAVTINPGKYRILRSVNSGLVSNIRAMGVYGQSNSVGSTIGEEI